MLFYCLYAGEGTAAHYRHSQHRGQDLDHCSLSCSGSSCLTACSGSPGCRFSGFCPLNRCLFGSLYAAGGRSPRLGLRIRFGVLGPSLPGLFSLRKVKIFLLRSTGLHRLHFKVQLFFPGEIKVLSLCREFLYRGSCDRRNFPFQHLSQYGKGRGNTFGIHPEEPQQEVCRCQRVELDALLFQIPDLALYIFSAVI